MISKVGQASRLPTVLHRNTWAGRTPALLCALLCCIGTRHTVAAVFVEDFSTSPTARGWSTFGDASLFNWNSTSQAMEVTWDSAQSNSYFFHSLGTVLGKNDDFALQFNLRLSSIQAGVNPAKSSTFEIAVGLLHWGSATQANFSRGTGLNSPNLVEWTYFPAADIIDATVSPVIVSSNSRFIPSLNFPLEMSVNDLFHIALVYTASNQTLVTTMTRNGSAFGPIQNVQLPGSFTDFRVDTVSINSYNDAGDVYGSILAHGSIDDITVITPPPPVMNLTGRITNGVCRLQFSGRTNWNYALERSVGGDLHTFAPVQVANAPRQPISFSTSQSPPARRMVSTEFARTNHEAIATTRTREEGRYIRPTPGAR